MPAEQGGRRRRLEAAAAGAVVAVLGLAIWHGVLPTPFFVLLVFWGAVQLWGAERRRRVWPETRTRWLGLLGIAASAASVRWLQPLSNGERYAAGAVVCVILGGWGAALWRWLRRSRSDAARPEPPGTAEPSAWRLARRYALLTGFWALALLTLVNAGGGAARREVGLLSQIKTHRPGAHRGMGHHGYTVRVTLPERWVTINVSEQTLQGLSNLHCVELDLRDGLLGVPWCLGDCISPAARQDLSCLDGS